MINAPPGLVGPREWSCKLPPSAAHDLLNFRVTDGGRGGGAALLAQPIAGSTGITLGPRAAGESGRPGVLPGGLLGSALAQHGLWRKGKCCQALGTAGIHIHAAGARRLPGPRPTQGPAGFHSDPHATGRASWPSGVTWSSPSGCPGRLQAGTDAGRQLGLLQSQTACVSLFPKALLAPPAAHKTALQTLGLHPRPHRLLSFISG